MGFAVGEGISMRMLRPSTSPAVQPKMRSADWLKLWTMPRPSMVMMPSTAVSTSARRRDSLRRTLR